MKKVLILNGHPDPESFCFALAASYHKGALEAGAESTLVNLVDLSFDPILRYGYRKRTELEPDLLKMREAILKADHLVFVYPNWWGTLPALLKGFIDRVFLPGFAFKYRENSPLWDPYLKGKTARLLVTMDSPKWFYSLFMAQPGHHAMKRVVLGFCGISPVSISSFGPVKTSSPEKRRRWLSRVEALGSRQV